MSGSVESQRQIQLTFQDKSTDSNLSVEVTRESWLNEVQAELQKAGGATAGGTSSGGVPTAEVIATGTAVWEEPAPRTEERPVPTPQEASGVESFAHSPIQMSSPEAVAEGFAVVSDIPETSAEISNTAKAHRQVVTEDVPDADETPEDHSVAPAPVLEGDQETAITAAEQNSPDGAVMNYDDVHPREELDFESEPLPEPLTEASPVITANLGNLTLPAALCDEELLQELAGIPDKMGFKIGEVAEMLGIKQYVLRYWETEFDVLKPKKAANNQRYYTKKDVENVYLIRKLLHRDRFSIEGARSALKDLKTVVKKEKDWSQVNHRVDSMNERLDHLLVDLRKLRQLFAE